MFGLNSNSKSKRKSFFLFGSDSKVAEEKVSKSNTEDRRSKTKKSSRDVSDRKEISSTSKNSTRNISTSSSRYSSAPTRKVTDARPTENIEIEQKPHNTKSNNIRSSYGTNNPFAEIVTDQPFVELTPFEETVPVARTRVASTNPFYQEPDVKLEQRQRPVSHRRPPPPPIDLSNLYTKSLEDQAKVGSENIGHSQKEVSESAGHKRQKSEAEELISNIDNYITDFTRNNGSRRLSSISLALDGNETEEKDVISYISDNSLINLVHNKSGNDLVKPMTNNSLQTPQFDETSRTLSYQASNASAAGISLSSTECTQGQSLSTKQSNQLRVTNIEQAFLPFSSSSSSGFISKTPSKNSNVSSILVSEEKEDPVVYNVSVKTNSVGSEVSGPPSPQLKDNSRSLLEVESTVTTQNKGSPAPSNNTGTKGYLDMVDTSSGENGKAASTLKPLRRSLELRTNKLDWINQYEESPNSSIHARDGNLKSNEKSKEVSSLTPQSSFSHISFRSDKMAPLVSNYMEELKLKYFKTSNFLEPPPNLPVTLKQKSSLLQPKNIKVKIRTNMKQVGIKHGRLKQKLLALETNADNSAGGVDHAKEFQTLLNKEHSKTRIVKDGIECSDNEDDYLARIPGDEAYNSDDAMAPLREYKASSRQDVSRSGTIISYYTRKKNRLRQGTPDAEYNAQPPLPTHGDLTVFDELASAKDNISSTREASEERHNEKILDSKYVDYGAPSIIEYRPSGGLHVVNPDSSSD